MILQQRSLSYILPAILLAVVGGCTAIPKAEDQAPQAPQVAPPPPTPSVTTPAQNWDERALTQGIWHYDAGRRVAVYRVAGQSAPLISLSCAGGSMRLDTQAFAAGGQPLAVDLKTSFGVTRMRFEPQGSGGSVLTLSPRDQKLDQMTFSRGRFALDASNGRTLTLPAHAEVGRAVEDCRG